MANFFTDNEDLAFYMEKAIPWDRLVRAAELDYRAPDAPTDWKEALETYHEVLTLVGQFAAEEIAPRAKTIDQTGFEVRDGEVVSPPAHDAIFEQLRDIGLFGMSMPRELGGMNAPLLLYFFVSEVFARADVSVMTHFGFHAATAMSLLLYSMKEGTTEFDADGKVVQTRFQKEIDAILAGKTWGSMDLTEPDAGSDLSALRTKAVKDAEGVWRVTGNKIFITSGHGNYHLVLAKTADDSSLSALSLFLVPLKIERDGKTITNGYVDRVEEKIGHHGSPTCSVQFDASEGHLIGEPGDGFALMLFLMNHARLGVGFEGVGMCEAAYRDARTYAAERKTMGQTLDQHPMIADFLEEMDTTTRALRAMAVEAALLDEMALRLETAEKVNAQHHGLSDATRQREIRRMKKRVRFLTPLVKYAASEAAVRFARLDMQIHGGNGYTQDYDAERYMRDSLVLPVYEGTSQIQGLMCLKDNVQAAMKNPQGFLREIAAAKLASVRANDPLERSVAKMQSQGYAALRHILMKIAKDKWTEARNGPLLKVFDNFTKSFDPKRDFSFGLLHAERYTRLLADVTMAEIVLDQAKQYPERRELAEAFIERASVRVRHEYDAIATTGDRLLQRLHATEEFEEAASA